MHTEWHRSSRENTVGPVSPLLCRLSLEGIGGGREAGRVGGEAMQETKMIWDYVAT